MEAERQRFTFRQTRRTVPITFSIMLVQASERRNELIEWGFRRTKPWGARLDGYDVVLDTMLKDGGPWHDP